MKFRIGILILFVLFSLHSGFAQDEFVEVKGLPTKEIFDLHVDKKGFLWVGHNLGISRYDGISFTHFTHPLVSSLSMTDILEDDYGRIWCHNFSGQVFYIKDEKMRLLESYDYTKEPEFPRMILHENELVITSRNKGLFVCDLKTLKGRYVPANDGSNYKTISLTVIGNKVIANNLILNCDTKWYAYDKKNGVRELTDVSKKKLEIDIGNYFFNPKSYGDTAFFILNPAGVLCKMIIKGETISVVEKQNYNSFINTLSFEGGNVWINTRNKTISYNNSNTVPINNVSDLLVDRHGNRWISTLDKGLFASYKNSTWQRIKFLNIGKTDILRHVSYYKNLIVGGTKNGEVVFQEKISGKVVWKYIFPKEEGGIEFLKYLGNDEFFISTSAQSFLLNYNNHKVIKILEASVRDLDIKNNTFITATPSGIYIMPHPDKFSSFQKETIDSLVKCFPYLSKIRFGLYNSQRTRSIRHGYQPKQIFSITKGVLHQLDQFGMQPILYNNRTISCTSLEIYGGKLYIGTFNGLLIKDNEKFKRFGIEEGLSSNIVLSLKKVGSHLWIFLAEGIEIFDLEKNKILRQIDLPKISGSSVFSVVEDKTHAYLTTQDGVYKVPLTSSGETNFESLITHILINYKDTITLTNFELPHSKNNIQFNLAVPVYHNASSYFRYRLKGEGSGSDWSSTKELERSIRFSSLAPGEYTFEAYAVVAGIQEKIPIVVHFTIKRPWWKQTWFILLASIFLLGGFYLLYRVRLRQLLKVEKMRRAISNDLHDEIGSTLSSINIYSELAKKEKENEEYLSLIQNNVTDVITKLDDLVWSINPKNDAFSQLINRMQLFAEPLMASSHIIYSFEYSPELLNINLSVDVKRTLYLLFKEIINNVAKHSKAKQCSVRLLYKNSSVLMEIKDDGIGFDQSAYQKGRTGLNSLLERTAQIKGKLKVRSAPDKGTNITIIAPVT